MKRWLITCALLLNSLIISSGAYSESTEELERRIEKIEKELEKSKKKSRVYYDRLSGKIDKVSDSIKLNAFATAGLTKSDSKVPDYNGIDNNAWITQTDSVLGVQMGFQVNEKTKITTQFVSKGGDEAHNTRTEWAYITYTHNQHVKARAGRMRIPYYMLSESLEVGYSYNWVRPPVEVYNLTSNNGELFDVILSKSYSRLNLNLQLFTGRYADTQQAPIGTLVFESENVLGSILYGNYGNFSGRLAYIGLDFTSTISNPGVQSLDTLTKSLGVGALQPNEDYAYFSNVGLKFDNGKLQIMGEYYQFDIDDTLLNVYRGWYLMGGYRLGSWTPYLSFSSLSTHNNDSRETAIAALNNIPGPVARSIIFAEGVPPDLAALPDEQINEQARQIFVAQIATPSALTLRRSFNVEQETLSLGVRWDISPGLALKLQADQVSGFEGGNGLFTTGADANGVPNELSDDSINILSLVIDVAF